MIAFGHGAVARWTHCGRSLGEAELHLATEDAGAVTCSRCLERAAARGVLPARPLL